jgi:hypothetical protein
MDILFERTRFHALAVAVLVGFMGFITVNSAFVLYENCMRFENTRISLEHEMNLFSENNFTALSLMAERDDIRAQVESERVLLAGDMGRFNAVTTMNATAEKKWRSEQEPTLFERTKAAFQRFF